MTLREHGKVTLPSGLICVNSQQLVLMERHRKYGLWTKLLLEVLLQIMDLKIQVLNHFMVTMLLTKKVAYSLLFGQTGHQTLPNTRWESETT